MKKTWIYKSVLYFLVVGNVVFFLWILRNGIGEGFNARTLVEKFTYLGLQALLIMNAAFLILDGVVKKNAHS